jgi:hypothetical protein
METRNVKQKEVGFAIHGLRAYIKALELAEGIRVSKNKYRYEIAADRTSARIILSTEQTEVENTSRSLTDWAKLGKDARLGLIGLRAEKETLRETGQHVQYTLNVISNEAYLAKAGQRMTEHPQTISDWAKKGHEIEREKFEGLNAAIEFGFDDVASTIRKDMIRLGIIREPRTAVATPAQSDDNVSA